MIFASNNAENRKKNRYFLIFFKKICKCRFFFVTLYVFLNGLINVIVFVENNAIITTIYPSHGEESR